MDNTKTHLTVWILEPEDLAKMKKAREFFDSLGVKLTTSSENLKLQTILSNHNGIKEVLLDFHKDKIDVSEAEVRIKKFSCAREIAIEKVIRQLETL